MNKINRNKNQTTKENSQRKRVHKGAVLQRVHHRRIFKGFGVAKRYCSMD